MTYDLACLIQIGINNIQLKENCGTPLNVHELRVLDQFMITTTKELKLKELAIQQEIDYYETNGYFIDQRPPKNTEPESDRGNSKPPVV